MCPFPSWLSLAFAWQCQENHRRKKQKKSFHFFPQDLVAENIQKRQNMKGRGNRSLCTGERHHLFLAGPRESMFTFDSDDGGSGRCTTTHTYTKWVVFGMCTLALSLEQRCSPYIKTLHIRRSYILINQSNQSAKALSNQSNKATKPSKQTKHTVIRLATSNTNPQHLLSQ